MVKAEFKRGFTLIELLVIIAIIALLLSILGPSLKKAKETGMRTVCQSNLRSLAQCMQLYTNDNDSEVPCGETSGSNTWVDHKGGALRYYNLNEDPAITQEQEEAIRIGRLWPYCSESIEMFRCATSRLGDARSLNAGLFLLGAGWYPRRFDQHCWNQLVDVCEKTYQD